MQELVLSRELPGLLVPWYQDNARDLPWRQDQVPYHIWVSEIMLQQTRVEAVKMYYQRFLQVLPTIKALAQAEEEQLIKLWEGLGYYSRVRNMQKAAQIIVQEYGGEFPDEYGEIILLPGIGDYTAGAIASICFEAPTPAVDGNVLRVVARTKELNEDIHSITVKKKVAQALAQVYPPTQRGVFTQSLMELGAMICVPKGSPKCPECSLKGLCAAYQNQRVQEFPRAKKPQSRSIHKKTVFVFYCAQQVAVHKRNPQGLLAGMWEFPNIEGKLTEKQALAFADQEGLKPIAVLKVIERMHRFTHVEWQMICYHITCAEPIKAYHWVNWPKFSAHFALPSAFKKCL